MNKPALMLFAAGLGTRMGTLVADRPKPLVHVNGRALIDHALDLTTGQPLGKVVVNLHYKGDMIRSHLAEKNIAFSHEQTLLETGGGLRNALPVLGTNPVLTLNTDAIWAGPNPIATLLNVWREDMEALLMMVPTERAIGHSGTGDFVVNGGGKLHRGGGQIYTGLQMIRTDALHDVKDNIFSMNTVWDAMIARQRLFGVTYTGTWCDVGRPSSIPLAEAMIKGGRDV